MKKLLFTFTFVVSAFFLIGPLQARAQDVSISLYPSGGYAVLNNDFAVDIMLATGGKDTTMARVVLRFDPSKIRITKAQHGDLYCQYPEDDYAADNTKGIVILTGYCLDPYYNSSDGGGILGRITFKPLVEGNVTLSVEFDGQANSEKSVVMDNGSPPQNILISAPSGGSYTVVTSINQQSSGTPGQGTKLPGVGILDNKPILVGIGLICLAGTVFAVDLLIRSARKRGSVAGHNTQILH